MLSPLISGVDGRVRLINGPFGLEYGRFCPSLEGIRRGLMSREETITTNIIHNTTSLNHYLLNQLQHLAQPTCPSD
jgi:hypothetical protein